MSEWSGWRDNCGTSVHQLLPTQEPDMSVVGQCPVHHVPFSPKFSDSPIEHTMCGDVTILVSTVGVAYPLHTVHCLLLRLDCYAPQTNTCSSQLSTHSNHPYLVPSLSSHTYVLGVKYLVLSFGPTNIHNFL